MTETSFYWEGTAAGDATLAPYSSNQYHTLWQKLFTISDNQGIIDGHLDSLEVIGITGGVKIKTGAALVDGLFYENDSAKSIEITEPVTDSRIDRVVIRKTWVTQQARITIIEGTENASPTAPAITQTEDAEWDIPLAQFLITTDGTITVTDERENPESPLFPPAGLSLIERHIFDGSASQHTFSNIPQIFRHLMLEGVFRTKRDAPVCGLELVRGRFNGDAGNNYTIYRYAGSGAIANVVSSINTVGSEFIVCSNLNANPNFIGSGKIVVQNYTSNIAYKTILSWHSTFNNDTVADGFTGRSSAIWKDTSPITNINISSAFGDLFVSGSEMSLYGMP